MSKPPPVRPMKASRPDPENPTAIDYVVLVGVMIIVVVIAIAILIP